ncbi:DUF2254 domain-containing protein [Rhodococcus tukisamuensis]|uniref:Uncharacterized membrane protein n=1 Tax=Rhodococcus tukisamuensis TaxID=168276 RepID=A0A1G7DI42_9NOCA|nr:DUF2254 domain-containing protein [Rhodococcus tukisamuensis]SDE51139.1 Uncharacterized membrane protein [Rhodococcus tukisamuensis]
MLRREAAWEYLRGALWVLPAIAVVIALLLGSLLSSVNPAPDTWLYRLAFQGTPDDARTLLIGTAGTMITVIALVLGLTVVALQLSSTQFSPRILRNFLRDRSNQLVLSVFVATFAYSMAGLYTVGVSAGGRTSDYPRLAVTWAIALLFLSLGALVYEVHHLSHSMQVDEIMRKVERETSEVVRHGLLDSAGSAQPPRVLSTAVVVSSALTGYVQAVHADAVVAGAELHDVSVRIAVRAGDHVAAVSTPLAWVWSNSGRVVDAAEVGPAVEQAVRIGFERTLEQDAAFGLRQLVDVASKALSPAINDPYTAVQAVDHLTAVMSILARRDLGPLVLATTGGSVTVPAYDFADYLDLACAQIRRYGSREPTVALALIRLLRDCAVVTAEADRRVAIAGQLRLIVDDATRDIVQPADRTAITAAADLLRQQL